MTAALLLAFGMAAPARLLEVRSENVEGRPAVVVVASAPVLEASVRRDGADVVVDLGATAPGRLSAPAVPAPGTVMTLEEMMKLAKQRRQAADAGVP